MALLRHLPLQALVLGALCVLGCRQWATPAPAPVTAEAAALPPPEGTEVSLTFAGGRLAHFQALPLLEANGMVASFHVPPQALGTAAHMSRLQLGLVEEAGHQVLREREAEGCGGLPAQDRVVLDGSTPLARLAGAVTQAEARGGGRVQVVVCGLEGAEDFETLAHFLSWLAPRAQSGTHVRLARR
jgi:hypothetical protein